jgi:hypothetical protein
MSNVYVLAFSVSVIYGLVKLLEMKYLKNEDITLKTILRDMVVVYISVVSGHFILGQIMPAVKSAPVTEVFTDLPNF